ncbi:Alg9-like mannosyltransferase family-domain-containing protein [Gymnopilus junonius]|uniref:Mannosyltransferase n=1 Tax=Gymnopilus junonius TaxID=109634 RepID=A0A9P5NV98_GYMJU|nr:Alg9-like mannosyltransferase family-domain-containing protein [Gymnopilus junonius]
MSIALDVLILATAWTHVALAPYTKVEESFNLHATHDVLMYGVGNENLRKYDHFTFPGAVPRTFVGSVLLAYISGPVIRAAAWAGLYTSKFDLQIIVRLVLATLNALTLSLIRRGTTRRFGRITGLFFALLTCTQFHLPFWMGRTIPNMFAMIPVNIAAYLMVDRAPSATKASNAGISWAIALLTSAAVIFRAEILLLLAPLSLQLLYTRHVSFFKLVKVGLISGLISLGATVLVDSYFWQQFPLWPEFSGIYFNVVQGKSAEWGTSPRHTYLTSFLPKLLLASLPLSVIGVISDRRRIFALLLPSLLFLGLISNLGHKEWRFVVYVVPVFNVAAARGARWMVSRRKNAFLGRLAFLAACGLIFVNIFVTTLLTLASTRNYPGGEALFTFHQLYPKFRTSPTPHIYVSNLAAQTGASLFLQLNAPPYYPHVPMKFELFVHPSQDAYGKRTEWIYNKTENLSSSSFSSDSGFTHLISEIPPSELDSKAWKLIKPIKSFDRWSVDWELLMKSGRQREKMDLIKRFDLRKILKLVESEKLWIWREKRNEHGVTRRVYVHVIYC